MSDKLHNSALFTMALAFALMLTCCLGAALFHAGESLLRRWRQGQINKARWMRLLK